MKINRTASKYIYANMHIKNGQDGKLLVLLGCEQCL